MISVKEFLQKRKESEGILTYTLMLPNPNPTDNLKAIGTQIAKMPQTSSYSTLENLIDECFQETHNRCILVADDVFSPFGNMMARSSRYSSSNSQRPVSSLFISPEFRIFILRQQVLLSTYDRLRKFMAYKNPLKDGPDFLDYLFPFVKDSPEDSEDENMVARNSERYGLDYILSHDMLSHLDKDGTIHIKQQAKYPEDASAYINSRSSALTERQKELLSEIEEITSLEVIAPHWTESDLKHELLQLGTLEFFQMLKGTKEASKEESKKYDIANPKTLINIHKEGSTLDSKSYARYIKEYNLIKDPLLIPGIDLPANAIVDYSHPKLSLADRLYCRFQIERLFGFDLSDCMYQVLENYVPESIERNSVNLLSNCFTLPNVFTRNIILQGMVESLQVSVDNRRFDYNFVKAHSEVVQHNNVEDKINPTQDEDLPSALPVSEIHKINERENLYSISHQRRLYNEYLSPSEAEMLQDERMKWEDNCKKVVQNLTEFVFPVYENYFFNLLWNSIRQGFDTVSAFQIIKKEYKIGDSLNACTAKADEECATVMFLALSRLLNNPYSLEKYFNISKNDDTSLSSATPSIIVPFPKEKHPTNINETAKVGGSKRKYVKKSTFDLRKRCIQANNINRWYTPAPDFLSLDYMGKDKIAPQIRLKYLRESISTKE